MKKYIIIKADTNDADYVTSKNEITDETLEIILPVIKAIEAYDNDKSIKYQKYNWWKLDYRYEDKPTPKELYVDTGKCSQEAFDYFNELTPYFEHGIHTIESIELLEVVNEIKLL